MTIVRNPAPRRQSGFTLVELIVVIAIIGIAASAIILSIPDSGGGVRAEAERFAARLGAARDLAIVESRPVEVEVDESGYRVRRRARGQWHGVEDQAWRDGTAARIDGGKTRIRFDTSGLATPLRIGLARGGNGLEVEIDHDGSVQIRR